MGRGRTHWCSTWHREDVVQPASSARSGSGMYSQLMNHLNRVSTRR